MTSRTQAVRCMPMSGLKAKTFCSKWYRGCGSRGETGRNRRWLPPDSARGEAALETTEAGESALLVLAFLGGGPEALRLTRSARRRAGSALPLPLPSAAASASGLPLTLPSVVEAGPAGAFATEAPEAGAFATEAPEAGAEEPLLLPNKVSRPALLEVPGVTGVTGVRGWERPAEPAGAV